MARLRLLLVWLLSALPLLGQCHDLNLTAVRVILQKDQVLVSTQTHLSRLAQSMGSPPERLSDADLQRGMSERLHLELGSSSTPTTRVLVDRAADRVVLQQTYAALPERIELRRRLFPEQSDSVTILSVLQDGLVVTETVLRSEPAASSALGFVQVGVHHILGGFDHVLFVLGLLILGGTVPGLLRTITAFTISHSLTLTLSVLGLVSLPARFVEPVIALSVALVGLEFFRRGRSEAVRPFLAFGFGLIHGFGFAGALTESGLPQQNLAGALFGFNVGVELGQMALVALVFPALKWLEKHRRSELKPWLASCAVAISGMGLFWAGTRIIGGS